MTARACGSSSPAALSGPGEAVHGYHLDPPTPVLVALGEPGLEDLLGPAWDHVQQTGRTTAVAHGGQVDHDGGIAVAPPGVAPHRGGTSRMRAKRAGESSTPRTSTPLNRSGTSLRICSARVRIALLAVCQEFPQGGCHPTDRHALQSKGPQPPLHRRAGQPRPGLSQAGGVLSPHPAAAGAGEAPQAHHQLCGSPPHRYVGQVPGHRPTGYSLGAAGLAEGVLKPDRHAALHNGPRRGQELAHRCQSQGVQPQERRQIRVGEGSLRHVEISQLGCVAAPIIGGPRPLPKQRRTRPTYTLQ